MATYVDGSFPTGAPVVAINSVNYKCNSFSYTKSASVEQISDENGRHSGATSEEEATTGTMELQFANVSVAEPTTAAANSTLGTAPNVNIGGTLSNVFFTSVTTTKPARGPWTSQVAFQVKVN